MSEWLFPNERPFWDTSHPEMPFADCNWHPTNESKEDIMTTTTTAETTTNEQETTMTENTSTIKGITMGERKNGNAYYNRAVDIVRHTIIRDQMNLGRVRGIEVTSCIPGETWENFTDDPAEVEILGKVCKKMGWMNGVCTVAKARKFNGEPNPDYEGHGWLVKYKPYVYKTGERAGQAKEPTITVVYPKEAFVWNTESGEPELNEQLVANRKARTAKRAANRAAAALKEANAAAGITTKPKRRSKKANRKATNAPAAAAPSADTAAMVEMVNALMQQNAQLIAALAARNN